MNSTLLLFVNAIAAHAQLGNVCTSRSMCGTRSYYSRSQFSELTDKKQSLHMMLISQLAVLAFAVLVYGGEGK